MLKFAQEIELALV